jgi:hypothetical protein
MSLPKVLIQTVSWGKIIFEGKFTIKLAENVLVVLKPFDTPVFCLKTITRAAPQSLMLTVVECRSTRDQDSRKLAGDSDGHVIIFGTDQ